MSIDSPPVSPPRPESALAATSARLSTPRAVAATVVAAVLANLAIWVVGAVAGGSFEFTDGDDTLSAAPGGVIFLTAVPLIVGLTLAAVLGLRWTWVIRAAQVAGSILALATIVLTLDADFDAASTVALSLNHVAIVPIMVVGLEVVRHRVLAR